MWPPPSQVSLLPLACRDRQRPELQGWADVERSGRTDDDKLGRTLESSHKDQWGAAIVKLTETEMDGVLRISPEIHEDPRGFFFEGYNRNDFCQLGIDSTFVQDNQSGSKQGVLRGLHYQIRHPQGKLVRAIRGEIFDVAVDMRRSSKTFGSWYGTILSAANRQMLWVPLGFAHGFYTLSDRAEVLYKVTDYYAPEWERTLLWNDPVIGIEWPLIEGRPPLLSPKDASGAALSEAEAYP